MIHDIQQITDTSYARKTAMFVTDNLLGGIWNDMLMDDCRRRRVSSSANEKEKKKHATLAAFRTQRKKKKRKKKANLSERKTKWKIIYQTQ